MKRSIGVQATAITLSAVLAACGGGYGSSGDFGATQGGIQDLGLARELIAGGIVPFAEAFPVEGMFSEHDLGLEGEPCETLLCLRGALGVAPTLDGDSAAWLQIGLSSTINPDTFERPSQTLIMTVDVSGSMGWTYDDITEEVASPGQLSRELLARIGAELGENDRVAIVTFGSDVSTRLETTVATDSRYDSIVSDLDTNGSTNMEAGLRRAYQLAADAIEDGATDKVRVVLFTDVQPNTGASSATEFDQIVKQGADIGAGLTVLALGAGIGQEVLQAIADVRGGNAFSLFSLKNVDGLMSDDWPYFVSPIANGLTLRIDPNENLDVLAAHGFPSDSTIGFEAATVFLSKRKGALLAELGPKAGFDLAEAGFDLTGQLLYFTPEGDQVSQNLSLSHDPANLADGVFFEQVGVEKTVSLAILTDAMKRAAEAYGDDTSRAIAIMETAVARYAADIEGKDDADLNRELVLSTELLRLMSSGAPQESPYGY